VPLNNKWSAYFNVSIDYTCTMRYDTIQKRGFKLTWTENHVEKSN